MGTDPADQKQLRAKYFDWCSARFADRFLRLSPDEIYAMAEEARLGPEEAPALPPGREPPAGSLMDPVDSAELFRVFLPAGDAVSMDAGASYRALVARVAEVLARRLALPSFEEWRAAYLEAPEEFESELLGLWKDAVGSDGSRPADKTASGGGLT